MSFPSTWSRSKAVQCVTSALLALMLTACASTDSLTPTTNTASTQNAVQGPVKMAGPEENWANFAGAVDRDRVDVVSFMLSQGVSPNTLVNDGDPALVRAIRMDNTRVMRALLNDNRLDIDLASDYGETALMLAAFKGNMELVNELIDRGASVNRVGGWTPLHYAATNGHDDIVKLLLQKGARVNVQTKAGVTPLYMAARRPSREVVMTLLRAGAYRDLCNDQGQSPADAALIAGDKDLGKYLAIQKCVKPSNTFAPIPSARVK